MDAAASAAPGKTGSRGFVEVISRTTPPLEVGEIEFDQEGVVRQRTSDRPIAFAFSYHGIRFQASVPIDRDAPLTISAVVGVLPYSMENAFGRKAAKAILSRARIPEGRLWMDDHQRIHLELRGVPPRPRTPVTVLSTVTALLIEAKPYLDLLEVSLRRRRRARRQ